MQYDIHRHFAYIVVKCTIPQTSDNRKTHIPHMHVRGMVRFVLKLMLCVSLKI